MQPGGTALLGVQAEVDRQAGVQPVRQLSSRSGRVSRTDERAGQVELGAVDGSDWGGSGGPAAMQEDCPATIRNSG